MTLLRPMHAAKLKKGETYEKWFPRWSWPLIGTPKLDGIRTYVHPDPSYGARTRTSKEIPNNALSAWFWEHRGLLFGMDGEMVWGDHESPDYSFQKTVSEFMSFNGSMDEFKFYIFDQILNNQGYAGRINDVKARIKHIQEYFPEVGERLVYVEEKLLNNLDEMLAYEEEVLGRNYEGIMLRAPQGLYKHGRSTMVQQGLIAVKRFADDEAEIIGIEALMRNHNEATLDAHGLMQRSSSKEFKVADNMMGKLVLRGMPHSMFPGVTFKVGTGFTEEQRRDFWDNFDQYKGQIVTFKHLPHGVKDKPRNLSFKAIRPAIDIVKG